MTVSLSDEELALVVAAAQRAGLAPRAWLGEAAVRAATEGSGPASAWGPVMRELMMVRAELMDKRGLLGNATSNLNQMAKHANSTGQLHAATANVLALVAKAAEEVGSALGNVEGMATAARRELLHGRP